MREERFKWREGDIRITRPTGQPLTATETEWAGLFRLSPVAVKAAPQRFEWRSKIAQLWNATIGKLVPRWQVNRWAEASIAAVPVGEWAAELAAGTLDVGTWQDQMRGEIKREYIRQYLIGRGGVENMTPRDWGSIGGQIADQFRYLDDFAVEIANGNLSEKQIARRSEMYINSAREALERAKLRAAMEAEQNEVWWKRDRNAESCEDCKGFEEMGWMPVEPWPYRIGNRETTPGQGDTICLTSCKCGLVYRKRRHVGQKYSPNQPRVPAGDPQGGQWTEGARGAVEDFLRKNGTELGILDVAGMLNVGAGMYASPWILRDGTIVVPTISRTHTGSSTSALQASGQSPHGDTMQALVRLGLIRWSAWGDEWDFDFPGELSPSQRQTMNDLMSIAGARPKMRVVSKLREYQKAMVAQKGGPGSGHFGHAGRPGKRGGSQPGRGGAGDLSSDQRYQWHQALNMTYYDKMEKLPHGSDLLDAMYDAAWADSSADDFSKRFQRPGNIPEIPKPRKAGSNEERMLHGIATIVEEWGEGTTGVTVAELQKASGLSERQIEDVYEGKYRGNRILVWETRADLNQFRIGFQWRFDRRRGIVHQTEAIASALRDAGYSSPTALWNEMVREVER